MITVSLDVDGLLPANSHRIVCVYFDDEPVEEPGDCNLGIVLPAWAKRFTREELELAVLYLAARMLGDYHAWAAYHLRALQTKKEVSRRLAAALLKEAWAEPPPGPVDMANYWRGRLKALSTLCRTNLSVGSAVS